MGEHLLGLESYDYSWKLTRSRWAWEFLRRNDDFLADAARHCADEISVKYPPCAQIKLMQLKDDQPDANKWGLAFFPDISLGGYDADAFWSPGIYPRTVSVNVSYRNKGEECDIWKRCVGVCDITHFTDRSGREQMLVRGSGCVLQVQCTGLSMLSLEPIKMRLIVDGFENLDEKLRLLERTKRLIANGGSETPEWTARSLGYRNALIAVDAHKAGLSYRDMAILIYGKHRADDAWSSTSRAMKDEMRRALARGQHLVSGGYKELLLGQKVMSEAA